MIGCILALSLLAGTDLPASAPDAEPLPEQADEEVYQRVLTYRREHLEVRPYSRELWTTPLVLTPDGAGILDYRRGWNEAVPRMAPVPELGSDWAIVRGTADAIGEDELAALLHDRGLQAQLAEARFWPRLWWGSGFGAVSAATLGTGIWLTWFNAPQGSVSRDSQAVGASLLTVGVTSALVALLYPLIRPEHAMTPRDAEARCDEYNERLRHTLELSPADLKRF